MRLPENAPDCAGRYPFQNPLTVRHPFADILLIRYNRR